MSMSSKLWQLLAILMYPNMDLSTWFEKTQPILFLMPRCLK